MFQYENFRSEIFFLQSNKFDQTALEVYRYQYEQNSTYQQYCNLLNKNPNRVQDVLSIPFLPIEFFKTKKVVTGHWRAEKTFKSSGTTGQERSKHHIRDVSYYHRLARHTFEAQYGDLSTYEILALLPSYQEQGESSLISMVDHFIGHAHPSSSYYLRDTGALKKRLSEQKQKKLLLGVTYALLDLAETLDFRPENLTIMETGGMKGRRREMVRTELHKTLQEVFGPQLIQSEYGMTELTSQAYGAEGQFRLPPWSRVLIRDINDPFGYLPPGKTGGINIIDLGNIDSCCFIETKDLGIKYQNETFEVLGRFDNSDIRGCNLLI